MTHQFHTHRHFSVAGLSLAAATLKKDFPELEAKAHNCLVILRWLSHFAEANHDPSCDKDVLRSSVLWAWDRMFTIMRESKQDWFNENEYHEFLFVGKLVCRGYNALSIEAISSGIARFPLRPKLHAIWHCILDVQLTKRNPASRWVFQEESFVGDMARLCMATHPAQCGRRTLQKWLVGFFGAILCESVLTYI